MTRVPEVRVLPSAEAAVPLLLDEICKIALSPGLPLVSFATGGTFAGMLHSLGEQLAEKKIDERSFLATHLDEYVGYPPDRRGGMVHELLGHCPVFAGMLRQGTFLPVPHREDEDLLQGHEVRLLRAGGVKLQMLGIGRNGHVAFNEPGTPFESGVHATDLTETTRRDAIARFRPEEPPRRAVTSGIATILAAERLVLCAFGRAKAQAVRAMLQGEVTTACPASALRRHGNLLVLLDREAASGLGAEIGGAGE